MSWSVSGAARTQAGLSDDVALVEGGHAGGQLVAELVAVPLGVVGGHMRRLRRQAEEERLGRPASARMNSTACRVSTSAL